MAGDKAAAIFKRSNYTTSLLGTAMSRIGLTFAVLDSGGSAADLGYVFAASVFPQVLVMLAGGALADRIGRRRVMLITDIGRSRSAGQQWSSRWTRRVMAPVFSRLRCSGCRDMAGRCSRPGET